MTAYGQPLAWLQECILSALGQTHRSLELLVRPDGPGALDAEARDWLQEQARRDPRLRLLPGRRNLGTFASLAVLFRQARGSTLVQLDADDRLHPRALELAWAALQTDPALAMVYTDCLEIDADGSPASIGGRQAMPFEPLAMLVQFITFHMRCVRRQHYDLVGGYRPALRYCGDYDLSLRLSEMGTVGFLPQPLYHYRLHGANTSRRHHQATADEAFVVARNALHRRGLAGHFHLRRAADNQVVLVPFPSWSRPPLQRPGGHIQLDPLACPWL